LLQSSGGAGREAGSGRKRLDTEGRRRSDNFEDRGYGQGRRAGAAGLPVALLVGLFRRLGVRGTLVLGAVVAGGYFLAPASVKQSTATKGWLARRLKL